MEKEQEYKNRPWMKTRERIEKLFGKAQDQPEYHCATFEMELNHGIIFGNSVYKQLPNKNPFYRFFKDEMNI